MDHPHPEQNGYPIQAVRSGAKWRAGIWAVGTLACLAVYAMKQAPPLRRTSVGVEERLMGTQGLEPVMRESAGSRKWLLIPEDARWSALSAVLLRGMALPRPALSLTWLRWLPPRLRVVVFPGTWVLEAGSLRRVWRHAAQWLDDDHIRAQVYPTTATTGPYSATLDLRDGKSLIPAHGIPHEEYLWSEGDDWSPIEELSYSLNSVPNILQKRMPYGVEEGKTYTVAGRRVRILFGPEQNDVGIYAADEESARRVLRTVPSGRFVALSNDGRTLFFTRDEALWRLDFRKPLPELLDEVPIPELPVHTR